MIRYFPNLYPDELLYSAFCRYSNKTVTNGFKDSVNDLFQTRNIIASWDFPSHLQSFVDNMEADINVEQIIFDNTMLSLFYPFLDQERKDYALEQMKSNNGKGIFMKLGAMASSISVESSLKYCQMCISEDIHNYGTAYWHRAHNVKGVTVCHKHSVKLLNQCPVCNTVIAPKKKNQFFELKNKCVNAHDLTLNCMIKSTEVKDREYTHELMIANSVYYLLNTKLEKTDNDEVHSRYLYYLREKELITPKGTIRQKELLEQFLLFYGNNFLIGFGLFIDIDAEYNWLSDMLRRTSRLSHPIKHILLINFLVSDFKEFFIKKTTEYHPFGEAPWLCLNPVASHYGESVVNNCKISTCTDTRKPVGTFECTCGFVYSRKGPDTCLEDRYKIGRIKSFGHVWKNKLEETLKIHSGSMRSVAKIMKADPNTIKKFVVKLVLETTWDNRVSNADIYKEEKAKTDKLPDDELKEKYFKTLMKFVHENDNLSRTEIRESCKKEYIWLYRHDKKLLYSILPKSSNMNNRSKNIRINWDTRDIEISSRVYVEIETILTTKLTERVTLSRIGRNLGILPVLEQHLDKLPKTKALFDKFYETIDAFQVRRATMVVEIMRANGDEIKPWIIFRKVGIKVNCSEYVKQSVEELSRQANNDALCNRCINV